MHKDVNGNKAAISVVVQFARKHPIHLSFRSQFYRRRNLLSAGNGTADSLRDNAALRNDNSLRISNCTTHIVAGKWRDTETKKAFYKCVVELLAENPGVRPEDVQIVLSSNDREDWSFGKGIASYLKD